MSESHERSPAERFSRLFRKAGVFLAKGQVADALVVFREGETLAQTVGDEKKLVLFREEIARCEQQLNQ
jgi:hypothetical protein